MGWVRLFPCQEFFCRAVLTLNPERLIQMQQSSVCWLVMANNHDLTMLCTFQVTSEDSIACLPHILRGRGWSFKLISLDPTCMDQEKMQVS